MRRIYLLYCLSGFLSLGYQVAWFRVFVDNFGSTNLTFAFVLANFIGGLGAGSLASRPLVDWLARRAGTQDPLRLYGLVELGVASSALLTLLLPLLPADLWGTFPYVAEGHVYRPSAMSHQAQLAVSTLCVFVPCFLMGVTFPLLCSAFRQDARFPAALYAWNTLGACLGVLASEFVLLAWLGHVRMYVAMVAGNVALGAYFWFARSERDAPSPPVPAPRRGIAGPITTFPTQVLFATAIVSGLLTGAFEADVLRRLQFLDCRTGAALSCISFWAIFAIFLASWTQRAAPRLSFRHIQIGVVVALLIYLVLWRFAYPLREWVNAADNIRVRQALPALPPGLWGSFQFFYFAYGFGALLLFTGLFVLPPFYLLSSLLPHICNLSQAEGRHLGLVYGANTLSFCFGLLAFTTVVPLVNIFYAMRLFLGLFALGAAFLFVLRTNDRWVGWKAATAVACMLGLVVATSRSFAPSYFDPSSPAATLPVRAMKSDGTHTTYIVEDPAGDLLYFDSHPMSGSNLVAQQYMRLMAHFPLLAHPRPASALLICFGIGTTASAITAHESIERLDIVDINEQVFATAPEFAKTNRNVIEDPRVRLVHDDGRRFLAVTDRSYDLITSEPPPPMFPGVARLYSVEYYRTARAHLTSGGLMTQWLPIDQMPLPAMRAAIASFVQVFPDSALFVGSSTNYILMGCNGPLRLGTVEQRFGASARVTEDLAPFGILRPVHLLARITKCGPTLVEEFGNLAGISDLRNDLSHVFHDPEAPSILTYDPAAMLAQIGQDGDDLACRGELEFTVLHLGRLKSMVPDFPDAALMSVQGTSHAKVTMADANWYVATRRVEASQRASAKQQYEQAAAQLEEALALVPEYPAVASKLGVLLVQLQRWEPALRAWRRLQASNPQDPAGSYGIAYTLFQLGRRDEALSVLQEQVQKFPRMVAMHRLQGDLLAVGEQWLDALAAYDRALQLDPNDKISSAGRAKCLERLQH